MLNKILVLSPLHNIGTTSVISCLSHILALRGVNTTLCYTDKKNNLAEYFGLPDVDAPPSNISIISSSMTETSVKKQVLLDYSHKLTGVDKLHILNIGSETIDSYSSKLLFKLILQQPPTQLCIIDVAEGIDDETVQEVLPNVDCVFVVINMSQDGINAYLNWMQSDLLPTDKVYPIVNTYNEHIMPIQKFAELLQTLPSRVHKVHYNPYINRCTLMKSLYELGPQIEKKDPRVAQLSGDFDRIYTTIIDANQERRFAFNFDDIMAKAKSKLNI